MKRNILRKIWQFFFKSRFLQFFLASFFSVILITQPIFPVVSQPTSEIRGVWLTTNDTDTLLDQSKLHEAIEQLSRLNFNTLYPVVWNSGYALYSSKIAQEAGIQPFVHKGLQGQDPLKDLISQAHQKGLLVLPWFEFGFMAPPTSELARKHPNWLTQKRDGSKTTISAAGEVVWLNPFHPQVQQFILSLVMEVMNLYNADGIQFDDHLSFPVEFGYDSYTKNLYQQETQKPVPDNARDEAWMRWRADKLTAFVSRLNQAIKAKKSNAIFSISPNPYDTAYRSYLQDWLTWVRQDIIDELVVQVYRPDLASFVTQLTRAEIQEARKKIPTGVGILTGLRNRPIGMEFIQEKVLAARQYGLGVSFFFYDSLWNYAPEPPIQRQSSFQALFRREANRELWEIPTPAVTETANPTVIENNPTPSIPKPINSPATENLADFDPYNSSGPTTTPANFDPYNYSGPPETLKPTPLTSPSPQPDESKPYEYAEDGIPIPVSW